MTHRLLIVQPYIAKYRSAFYQGLQDELARWDVDLRVVAGAPDPSQRLRRDVAVDLDMVREVEGRTMKIGPALFQHVGSKAEVALADSVILPAAATSLDTLATTWGRRRKAKKVGLWGHIKSYTGPQNPIDAALEQMIMKRADHIFAYTPTGAEHAERRGVEASKITTVMNSLDVSDVLDGEVGGSESQDFRRQHALDNKIVYSYWGGLDSSKRIEFLREALDALWCSRQDVHFLIGGRGSDESLLAEAERRGQVTLMGYADAATKRLMAAVSIGLVVPGRIGLIAVEALALRLPILTTDWPFHAPEFEYLAEGMSVISSADSPDSYASLLSSFPETTATRGVMDGEFPTLGAMIGNFSAGVRAMIQS